MSLSQKVKVLKLADPFSELDKLAGPNAPTVVHKGGGKSSKLYGRLDLLPWKSILQIGYVLDEGAKKYDENNWRLLDELIHINHALHHIGLYLTGCRADDHLSHAACRMLMACEISIDKKLEPEELEV